MEDVYDFKDVFANWFFFLLFEILFFRNFYLLHCSLPRIKGLRKCMQPINGLFLMSYLPEDYGCPRQRWGRRPWADLASIYIDHWVAGPFLVGTRIRSGIPYSGIPSQLMSLRINNGRGLMHCLCGAVWPMWPGLMMRFPFDPWGECEGTKKEALLVRNGNPSRQ